MRSNLHDARRGSRRSALAGPVDVEELAAEPVHALEGVGAEVVALGLEQIRGQARAAVGIVVAERGGNGGQGDAELDGGRARAAIARSVKSEDCYFSISSLPNCAALFAGDRTIVSWGAIFTEAVVEVAENNWDENNANSGITSF